MKHVVITGSSRGIGKALAFEFLKRGYRVSVTGRNLETIDIAVNELIKNTGNKACHGFVCDLNRLDDLQNLWRGAASLQEIDTWINNAGINHINHKFHQLDPEVIGNVVETNIRGTLFASRVALEGLLKQGSGYLYNMEGFGSDGRIMVGMSTYGTSKNAIRYFTNSLVMEYKSTPVKIGSIRPGMVVTDMLLEPLQKEPEKNQRALSVFHTLADPADRVAPWIVSKIIKNKKHGARISWLTTAKISWRFFSGMFKKRKVKGLPDY